MKEKKTLPEEKIKKLEELIAKKKAELIREKGRLSEVERRRRTRRLIETGGLVEAAGLLETDQSALLGALLEVKKRLEDELFFSRAKTAGDSLLKEREAKKKKAAANAG